MDLFWNFILWNQHFFRQINDFTKELNKELISREIQIQAKVPLSVEIAEFFSQHF